MEGVLDSVKNIGIIFYLDREIGSQKEKKTSKDEKTAKNNTFTADTTKKPNKEKTKK